jgi:hypothetical protein
MAWRRIWITQGNRRGEERAVRMERDRRSEFGRAGSVESFSIEAASIEAGSIEARSIETASVRADPIGPCANRRVSMNGHARRRAACPVLQSNQTSS